MVGAGAVGQVYGRHLALGGARVAFLVKPKHASAARRGFTMYPLRRRGRREPVRFDADAILTEAAEAHARPWDQVWLCTSTPALDGEWVDELLGAIPSASVITLQPGLHVRDRLAGIVGAERVVSGAIGMVSYQAPLLGEDVPEPGVAYAFPFGSSSRFSGERDRVAPIVAMLRAGGCPARIDADAQRFLSFTSAVLMPHIVALEGEGWSLSALRAGKLLPLAARASREVLQIVAHELGTRPPWYTPFIRITAMRIAFAAAPHAVPFDLEAYLRYHFTKVGDQTRMMVGRYLEAAERLELPSGAIAELSSRALGSGDHRMRGGSSDRRAGARSKSTGPESA